MFKQFGVLLKKEHGFERINEEIVRMFEVEGWKAERNINTEHILISSNKVENAYRKQLDLVCKLKQLLTARQLERCIIIELKKGDRSKSSLDRDGHEV